MTASQATPRCKHCGSERTARTERKTFMQKVVLHKLGLYPWECASCWKVFISSERGKRTRRHSRNVEGSSLKNSNA